MARKLDGTVLWGTAALAGLAWLTACGDGAVEPAEPTVPDPPRATTVAVTPATAELTALGDTTRFTAEVRDQNGQVMAGATVAWASSDTAVAAVDATGQVTAAANGAATIMATAGSASGTAAVTVAQVVSVVAVSPAADTLVAFGDTVRLTAEPTDANGHAVAAATEFAWASSDTLVARVDEAGLVETIADGEAAVTATTSGVTGRAELVVVPPLPTTVAVSPDTIGFTALGQTERLAVEVREQSGRVMGEAVVSWASGDTLVAAVDSVGLVRAVGGGATTIIAEAGEVSDDVAVIVMQSAGSVVVTPVEGTIELGDTLRLAAEAFDENGHPVSGALFFWSSSNPEVARVSESGLVEGMAEGTVRITATAGSGSGTAEITVENPDREALVALYNATGGPNWVNATNWLTDAPLGEWYGVSTHASGRVYALDLSGGWDNSQFPSRFVRGGLSGTIPPELGRLSNLGRLDLSGNDLSGAIPPELGGLSNLWYLDLSSNDLSSAIPPGLGGLSNLQHLNLFENDVFGPIPPELGGLSSLRHLRLDKNGLSGAIPPELGGLSNLEVLNLDRNALSGAIPPELGGLSTLQHLHLDNNDLSGAIPTTLLELPLRSFVWATRHYLGREWRGDLCAPGTSVFLEWLDGIREWNGPFCNASDRTVLTNLYDLLAGSAWTQSDGWLGGPALEEWRGVETDSLGHVTALVLSDNGLSGSLPGAVGALGRLVRLRIDGNELGGRLPLSLTALELREFHYDDTDLCEPADAGFRDWLDGIPSRRRTAVQCAPATERDALVALYESTGGPGWLIRNGWLTEVPLRRWHGVQTDAQGRVVALDLDLNALSGPIPPELGALSNLQRLDLSTNGLSGAIPPELGRLANLRDLDLSENNLSGPVPSAFGDLSSLTRLDLSGNSGLTGALPSGLGDLELESLLASGTDLCLPQGPDFEKWLSAISERWIVPCGPSAAYLVQAVQSRAQPVPLVADEDALLRVFVTAARETTEGIPDVRARFYLNGTERHVADIAASPTPIPPEIDEGDLSKSVNAEIPGWIVQPDLEMVVEIDPGGALDPGLGVPKRIPEEGRMAIEVREMPVLNLTVIPFLWSPDPETSIIELVEGMEADPEGHALLERTHVLLPVGDIDVEAHAPVASTSNNSGDLLAQTEAIRVLEGGGGHYMGMMSEPIDGPRGQAYSPGWSSFSAPASPIIAHELGHNMSLLHPQCGTATSLDLSFPHARGALGAWGYDRRRARLVPPTWKDHMSYCSPTWTSDYYFTKALRYRLADERVSAVAHTADPLRSLLLWGGVGADGTPFLNPAFVVDAPPALPDSAGHYTLTGRTVSGGELFSLSFTMPETADGDESSSFVFALPAQPDWANALTSLTLSGPAGTTTLDGDSDTPMTILRDPVTGRVRGFLRDLPGSAQAAADAVGGGAGRELDMLFSRGIPDQASWRR